MALPNTIRDLQIQSGDPASILAQSRGQAQSVANSTDPYTLFNEQLMQLLQRHQSLGTKRFQEQGFNAQQEQNNRVSAKTPSSLIGAAPGVQNSVRSASAGALDPTINQANNATQTFGEQISSFGQVLDRSRQFAADMEARAQGEKDNARETLLLALELGGAEGLDALDKENPSIFKVAGLDKDTLIAAAKRQETLKNTPEPIEVSGGNSLVTLNPTTGQYETSYTAPEQPDAALTASQKTRIDTLNTVMKSLDDYRRLYESLVGGSGINITGTDAGSLAGAYNALIFQIAQAAGTGALQAADREVVEAMIPNPTSIRGGVGAFIKGGKTGGLSAIDQAKSLFQNNLAAIQGGGSAGGGMLRVREKATGQTGSIPVEEFDPALYEEL